MFKPTKGLRMVVFDLDGVLVDVDSGWQVVHRAFGVDNEENYRKYMRGEIDFREFMKSDIGLWGKARVSQIKSILDGVPLMRGAEETVSKLRGAGYGTAIISSGISLLADRVKETLRIDLCLANRLLTDGDGRLTGEGKQVVELSNKVVNLRKLASSEGITPKQCAVVGDSIFDIQMFEEAGLSIAFNTKDKRTMDAADIVVKEKDLRGILPYLT